MHSEKELVVESVRDEAGPLEGVIKVKERDRGMVNQHCISREDRRPLRWLSPNEGSPIRQSSTPVFVYIIADADDSFHVSLDSLRQEMTPLNLDRLQHWIDRGLIDPTQPITMKELFETRCVHGIKDGVKLLGDVRNLLSSRLQYPASLQLTNWSRWHEVEWNADKSMS